MGLHADCTYCSGPKRPDVKPLPALQRYRSRRITDLHDAASAAGRPFLILSGLYGLLAAEQEIPWYDHLLQADEVSALATAAAEVLRRQDIGKVSYHTADPQQVAPVAPYAELIRQACATAGVELEIVLLEGDPV